MNAAGSQRTHDARSAKAPLQRICCRRHVVVPTSLRHVLPVNGLAALGGHRADDIFRTPAPHAESASSEGEPGAARLNAAARPLAEREAGAFAARAASGAWASGIVPAPATVAGGVVCACLWPGRDHCTSC